MSDGSDIAIDTPELRKARGAYFTPLSIARYITAWAARDVHDSILEPSCGDAAFLVEAVRSLQKLGNPRPLVTGVEIHRESAESARSAVINAGGIPEIELRNFFDGVPSRRFDAVVGNPPYVRYQDWSGESRVKSREAALASGVNISSLASSWAAFTVHSTAFLSVGGRLGLVLPAELLSTNYAAPIRQFLFDSFRSIDLVLFNERVFPEAEADVVLLLAEGFAEGPALHAAVYQANNADDLNAMAPALQWSPSDPSAKWTGSIVASEARTLIDSVVQRGYFERLQAWGETTLGMVSGNNAYFALNEERVLQLGLEKNDLIRLSPPGSSHLRGITLTNDSMARLSRSGLSTWLFRPKDEPSAAARRYIRAGEIAGIDKTYKTRIRKEWWRVPLLKPADLLLTYMNADTPRIVTNEARAHHLNSVHGVYLSPELRGLGRDLLPTASLNSVTTLSAEITGRSYGGGILKLEPREADAWLMPSADFVRAKEGALRSAKPRVATLLRYGRLNEAISLVDEAMFSGSEEISESGLRELRQARAALVARRVTRSESGRTERKGPRLGNF